MTSYFQLGILRIFKCPRTAVQTQLTTVELNFQSTRRAFVRDIYLRSKEAWDQKETEQYIWRKKVNLAYYLGIIHHITQQEGPCSVSRLTTLKTLLKRNTKQRWIQHFLLIKKTMIIQANPTCQSKILQQVYNRKQMTCLHHSFHPKVDPKACRKNQHQHASAILNENNLQTCTFTTDK